MDKKKIDFIIQYFGCKTPINGEMVLTSLANVSHVPANEFWNVFTGDAYDYFQIEKSEKGDELDLILDNGIKSAIEREIEHERISKLEVGFGWEWVNNSVRCYLEDASHNKKLIPFIFLLNNEVAQGWVYIDNRLDTRIIDKASLLPVNSGGTAILDYSGCYYIKGGKFGCINKTGKVLIPLIYDNGIVFTNPFWQ